MKNRIWPALALALAVTACGEAPPEAPSGPSAPAGITIADGTMSLPPVKGNPAAVYFSIANSGAKDVMIQAAAVDGAKSTMLHQMGTWNLQPSMDELMQIPVPKGQTVKFEPGGLHVMVHDLSDTLVAGGKTQVTLSFIGGDKMSFPVDIRAAGDER